MQHSDMCRGFEFRNIKCLFGQMLSNGWPGVPCLCFESSKIEPLGKRAYDRACGLEWTNPFPTLIPWPCQFWNVMQKCICYEHEYISTFPCLFFQKEYLCHSSSSPSDEIYIYHMYIQTPAIINSFERSSRINFVRSTHTQPQQPRPECWMLKELLVKLVGFLPNTIHGTGTFAYICLIFFW